MRTLVKNIGKLVGIQLSGRQRLCGAEMNRLETLDNAWLLAEDGRIAAFGRMDACGSGAAARVVDAEGGMLFPSFCDSHTHLVYAGSREQEFLDKINGLSYEEIARRFHCSVTTCRTQMCRAKARCRKLLQREGTLL